MIKLNQRDIDILSLLVSEYVATATPVGSVNLAGRFNLGLSSATVRNVLAKLEDMGLLMHPHTSAGRLPTPAGLRFYVNTIINRRELTQDERSAIERQFTNSPSSVENVLKRTTKILSLVSSYTGLVVMPKPQGMTFKHMEFIPLSTGKLLGIFISREGLVHNRVIDIGDEYSYPELEKISNYCNRSFYGCSLEDALKKVSEEFEKERTNYDKLFAKALLWSKDILLEASESELLVQGESLLLNEPEFADVEKLKHVMEELEEKKNIMHLLNRSMESEEVCVFIGAETGVEAVSDCSIVTTPYKKEGKVVGTLGVIGPTRMNYSRVIPTVDFTARLVSDILGR